MFCEACGKQIPDNSKFCDGCGTPVKPVEKTAPDPYIRPPYEPSGGPAYGRNGSYGENPGPGRKEPGPYGESGRGGKKKKGNASTAVIALLSAAVFVLLGALVFLGLKTFGVLDGKKNGDEGNRQAVLGTEETLAEEVSAEPETTLPETASPETPAPTEPSAAPETTVPASAESQSEYILPNSDSAYLTEADLSLLTKEELRLARNEIYARHGRKFKDSALSEYFMSKSWYVPLIEPNHFNENVFNDYETKNRKLIADYEKKMGY